MDNNPWTILGDPITMCGEELKKADEAMAMGDGHTFPGHRDQAYGSYKAYRKVLTWMAERKEDTCES